MNRWAEKKLGFCKKRTPERTSFFAATSNMLLFRHQLTKDGRGLWSKTALIWRAPEPARKQPKYKRGTQTQGVHASLILSEGTSDSGVSQFPGARRAPQTRGTRNHRFAASFHASNTSAAGHSFDCNGRQVV